MISAVMIVAVCALVLVVVVFIAARRFRSWVSRLSLSVECLSKEVNKLDDAIDGLASRVSDLEFRFERDL